MLTKTECYILSCDICSLPLEPDCNYIPHFDSKEEARIAAEDYAWESFGDLAFCDHCLPICVCDFSFSAHGDGHDGGARENDHSPDFRCDGFKYDAKKSKCL